MKQQINIGLLGLGTVGSGVVHIIQAHQEQLQHQIGCPIQVKKILVKDFEKKRDVSVEREVLTDRPEDIINNDEIDVVIEVIGGVEETKEYIITALNNKKHVVTANKDLMALYGGELLSIAAENGCDLFYEASVGGGIPLIRSLVEGLSSDRITKMMGIINGTTNYILTKMTNEKASYDDVLKEAQALGFAEADPTADVEGLDSARKMVILSTLGFSMRIDLDDVSVEGISKVGLDDIEYAQQFGYTMKLIGIAESDNGRVEISVQPTLLPNTHPLASVNNEFNAVYVYGEAVGETMFYGPGAGQLPTATAVVSDLVAVVKNMRLGVTGKSVILPQYDKQLKEKHEIYSKYFLRFQVKDEAGAFSKISSLFADHEISLEKLLQLPVNDNGKAEIIVVTHQTTKQAYEEVVTKLRDLDVVYEVKSSYRVEGE
ncbi:homoserine dehydrogenase [Pueribacillus sp. YX66]|uniref:homoserine dehydrogenase n=1 Tax=Pueribacillus sp. YX66 TaxID=3229242 RepID=UPI00358DA04C